MKHKLNQIAPAQVEYPEPTPLIPEVEQGQPYPIDALPPIMAAAAKEIAKIVQAPEAMAAQCVIGAATHLAQSRINADHPRDIHGEGMPCSLLILTLGDSGDGKSRCRDLAFRPIDQDERRRITDRAREKAELMEQARQSKGVEAAALREEANSLGDGKTLFDDVSIEGLVGRYIRGMAAASWDTDEGGQFFGGYSLQADTRRNTLGVLTKVYDNGKISRTRSVSNEEGSGTVYDRRLTVHILAQEAAVRESLADPLLRGQGILARFLFAAPASLAGTRFTDPELLIKQRRAGGAYYESLEAYWQRCREILATPEAIEHGEVKAPIMPLTDDAVRCLEAFDRQVETQLVPLGDYFDVKAFARRALEQAARLCAVFALFDGRAEVNAELAKQATRIAQYSLDEWTRHSAGVVISPLVQQAQHFIEWAQMPERSERWQRFTGRQFSQYAIPKALRPAKARNKALALLIEHDYLLVDGSTYSINPLLRGATRATKATKPSKANVQAAYSDLSNGLHTGYTQATNGDDGDAKPKCSPLADKCSPNVAHSENPQEPHKQRGTGESVAHVAHVAPTPKGNKGRDAEKTANPANPATPKPREVI